MPLRSPAPAARASRRETGAADRSPLALKVGFVGERGLDWLGAWVEAVTLSPAAERLDGPGAPLDCVVIDPDPHGVGRPELERLASAARASGAPIVGVARGGQDPPAWSGLADLAIGEGSPDGAGSALSSPPPIDPREINPIGFRHFDVAGFVALLTGAQEERLGEALPLLEEVANQEPVVLYAPRETTIPALPPGVMRTTPKRELPSLLRMLRGNLAVVDHPAFHRDDFERATWLVRLCAAGIPVAAAGVSEGLRALLGAELADAVEGPFWPDMLDHDLRERASVAARRAALRGHSLDARWRALAAELGIAVPPRQKVSVVLSTRRGEWLEHGLGQVAKQTYAPLELVVVLHGREFEPDVEEWLARRWDGELRVVRAPSDVNLGQALNLGLEAATGTLVTKMDDDDPYSVDHVWDLVLAAEYSGAELIGKAAEFVYLEEIDLLTRRFMGDTERRNHRLAGGGLMARREALVEVGGWPARPRGEDTVLIRTFMQADRPVHRTHGYGYILYRHGRDHTWNTYVDYFLIQSEREWRGLRYDQAGIE